MDVCCLNRPFDDQSLDRIRMESEAVLAILNRCLYDWAFVGSEAIDYEISKIPDNERKTGVKVLAAISRDWVTVDESILRRASEGSVKSAADMKFCQKSSAMVKR